jgi:hypothetical protein
MLGLHIALLKELQLIYLQKFYKHLAPNGAKQDIVGLRSSVAVGFGVD